MKNLSEFSALDEADETNVTLEQIKNLPIYKKINELGYFIMDKPGLWERSKNIHIVKAGEEDEKPTHPWQPVNEARSYYGIYQNGVLRFVPRYGTPSKIFSGDPLITISDWESMLNRLYVSLIRSIMLTLNISASGFNNPYRNPNPDAALEFLKNSLMNSLSLDVNDSRIQAILRNFKNLPDLIKKDPKFEEYIKIIETIQRVKARLFL